VLRATERKRTEPSATVAARFPVRDYLPTRPATNAEPAPGGGQSLLEDDSVSVSLVLLDDGDDTAARDAAIDACRAQTWPQTELIVVDRRAATPLADTLAQTTGDLVALADTAVPLRETAVELALRLPPGSRFFTGFGDKRYAEHERALLGR
jgi:hypothetical protein